MGPLYFNNTRSCMLFHGFQWLLSNISHTPCFLMLGPTTCNPFESYCNTVNSLTFLSSCLPFFVICISLRLSQPHFEASVRMRFALAKVGTWSPPGLPKLQSSIAGVKTPCLEVFFIPLERSWSVDVENGLAWAIRISATQVMVEKRVRSQIGSLTPDH